MSRSRLIASAGLVVVVLLVLVLGAARYLMLGHRSGERSGHRTGPASSSSASGSATSGSAASGSVSASALPTAGPVAPSLRASSPAAVPATPSASSRPSPVRTALTLQVGDDPTFGRILLDVSLNPLYYDPRAANGRTATCEPACLAQFTPLIIAAGVTPTSGGAVSSLATIRRADGRQQVSAYGHPLYRYRRDPTGGATPTGNGVAGMTVATDRD